MTSSFSPYSPPRSRIDYLLKMQNELRGWTAFRQFEEEASARFYTAQEVAQLNLDNPGNAPSSTSDWSTYEVNVLNGRLIEHPEPGSTIEIRYGLNRPAAYPNNQYIKTFLPDLLPEHLTSPDGIQAYLNQVKQTPHLHEETLQYRYFDTTAPRIPIIPLPTGGSRSSLPIPRPTGGSASIPRVPVSTVPRLAGIPARDFNHQQTTVPSASSSSTSRIPVLLPSASRIPVPLPSASSHRIPRPPVAPFSYSDWDWTTTSNVALPSEVDLPRSFIDPPLYSSGFDMEYDDEYDDYD